MLKVICQADPQKASSVQACKQCLWTFPVKIVDILDQKNASPYLGASHMNFSILDVKK
jgi:hypothetical protein